MEIITKETDAIKTVIGSLTTSGMIVERVGEDAYNVISKATGAVLKRLIPMSELVSYQRCMDYVAKQHGRDISERFRYTKPVHGA